MWRILRRVSVFVLVGWLGTHIHWSFTGYYWWQYIPPEQRARLLSPTGEFVEAAKSLGSNTSLNLDALANLLPTAPTPPGLPGTVPVPQGYSNAVSASSHSCGLYLFLPQNAAGGALVYRRRTADGSFEMNKLAAGLGTGFPVVLESRTSALMKVTKLTPGATPDDLQVRVDLGPNEQGVAETMSLFDFKGVPGGPDWIAISLSALVDLHGFGCFNVNTPVLVQSTYDPNWVLPSGSQL